MAKAFIVTSPLRSAVAALALAVATGLSAEQLPRKDAIDSIIAAQRAIDLPLFRRYVMPLLARSQARELLAVTGKTFRLGEEWRQGNPYWDRAETILFHDRMRVYGANLSPDAQAEKEARDALDKLTDAQLAEVLGFYRSDVFRKYVQSADAALAGFALSMTNSRDRLPPDVRQEVSRLAAIELTKEERKQLEDALSAPAFQVLRQGSIGRLQAAANPATIAGAPIGPAAKRYLGEIAAQFRKAHPGSIPQPPVYESDFTYNRVAETEYRKLADDAGRGDSQALEKLQRSAQAGDPVAQVELGRLYALGRGVPQDPGLSFAWTNRAAVQGMPRAVYNLALHYQKGMGVPEDLAKAVQYFRQAADRNFARAQLALGLLHRHGTGAPQDFEASLRLLRAAADQELPGAYLALAEAYDAGAGTFRDEREASRWLAKAIRLEYPPAMAYRSQREKLRAELQALVAKSPPSAKGVPASVDKSEANKQLLQAAREGDVDVVKLALRLGADVQVADVERPYRGDTPLHHAARSGNVEVAAELIARGADPNVAGPGGYTPLHVAAGLRRQAMAEYLLKIGANPNAMDKRGTPLHAATVQGHAEMVALLLSHGADPNARDATKSTPLHMIGSVARYFPSHTQIVRLLADGGADLFAVAGSGEYTRTAFEGAIARGHEVAIALLESRAKLEPSNPAALPLAVGFARRGYLVALQELEAKGISLTAKSARGETALHGAAGANSIAVADYLLSKGLDIDARAVDGLTPLHRAIENGRLEMVPFLLDRGASIEAPGQHGFTPLQSAVYWRKLDVARLLLERKANIDARDSLGRSTLEIAIHTGSAEMARLLFLNGASPRARDDRGRTALHKASHARDLPILLELGAEVNARDHEGLPPLFYAVSKGRSELAKALLDTGASVELAANDGTTVLHHAAKRGEKVLELALSKVPRNMVDARDAAGRTPLHWAAKVGQKDAVALLLRAGADKDARDKDGNTPAHFAVRSGDRDSVYLLVGSGADTAIRNTAGRTPAELITEPPDVWSLGVFFVSGP